MTQNFLFQTKEIKVHLEEARGRFYKGSAIIDHDNKIVATEAGGRSRLNRMYKKEGTAKQANEKTEFRRIMERFQRQGTMKSDDSGSPKGPKTGKTAQSRRLKVYRRMFSHISEDRGPKNIRSNYAQQQRQHKLLQERTKRYAKHYLQLSLIEKYLVSKRASSKINKKLETEIERSHRAQKNARETYDQRISPRLFSSMPSPAITRRKMTPPRSNRLQLRSQDTSIRPIFTPRTHDQSKTYDNPSRNIKSQSPRHILSQGSVERPNTDRLDYLDTEDSLSLPPLEEASIKKKGAPWTIKLLRERTPGFSQFSIKLV